MKLNVLICTYNEGVSKVKNVILSPRSDVEYIVSHQFDTSEFEHLQPIELKRSDVKIYKLKGKGLSVNRNCALVNATGDIAVIADDDVKYNHSYFDTIIEKYAQNPDLDMALFKIKTGRGEQEYKSYPESPLTIVDDKHYFISSIEISFRVKSIRNCIWFDTRFGIGSKYLIGGEETAFIHDCQKNGLSIRYFPEYIVEHPYESSNKTLSKYDKNKARTHGALDMRKNGWISVIRTFYAAIRQAPQILKNGTNPVSFVWNRIFGAGIVKFTKTSKYVPPAGANLKDRG